MHIFQWVVLILFAYGIHGFGLVYLKSLPADANSAEAQSQNFLRRAGSFERKWLLGCVIALGLGLVGWMVYDSNYSQLEAYTASMGIDATLAPPITKFSVHSVGWFVLYLSLSIVLFALIFRGTFTGKNAMAGGMLIGALVVLDLTISDSHWVLYWNAGYKYASNLIFDLLRDKPHKHGVDFLPYGSSGQQITYFRQFYDIEW